MSDRKQKVSRGAQSDRAKPDSKSSRKSSKDRGPAANDVGRVLKSVYDRALREDVPPDFLDLLGKLD